MTVAWECEGCGWHVIAVARDVVPAHQLCSLCEWLCEVVTDPEEIERLRKRLDRATV